MTACLIIVSLLCLFPADSAEVPECRQILGFDEFGRTSDFYIPGACVAGPEKRSGQQSPVDGSAAGSYRQILHSFVIAQVGADDSFAKPARYQQNLFVG